MKTTDILTEEQRETLRSFAAEEDLAERFVLCGGTALSAFHLFHRRSDDLDFFSLEPVDALRIRSFVDGIRVRVGAERMEGTRIYDRHIFVLPCRSGASLKMEFTHYPYTALQEPSLHDGVRVESLRDIAADKLMAFLDRFEPKDYYDLYFLLQHHTTLSILRKDVEEKFSFMVDPVQLGAACAQARNLPILPHLVQPLGREVVPAFFEKLARGLRSDVLEE